MSVVDASLLDRVRRRVAASGLPPSAALVAAAL
ncbi:MAG: hypothetical protein JWN08_3138, partial [Frankiales bacterium]|nr:hypothetical protein [Frankiales bacterium]